ncbi:hypothetical protein AAFF_G00014370 [Aldrovandia affinis]|uniref:Uncharacterized protein n=1 Tax=Aldrovandia affinis TaxID=143900 RepID=A0AAD7WHC3_9TELE|nr:hypothetical protein AAFF_G00014370 [Aldrovandia affinis]
MAQGLDPPSEQGPLGGQEHFLHAPHPMQGPMIDVPQQMRRSLSEDLTRFMGGNPAGNSQHFPPRGLQMQQHNIMGQPFIELRHRAPESRLRLPFGPPDHPPRPPGFGDGAGPEMGSASMRMGGHPMASGPSLGMNAHLPMSSSLENLHQHRVPTGTSPQHPPLMRSLSHPANSFGMALPTAQPDQMLMGGEEKIDADDSAVKDLEDVEVKDLDDDDLENLNLDADDGKGLDLEANDLHLDDLLRSGKFDIIAYTDPELDLEDKKDMFNEELDLSDPIDEHSEASDLQKALSEKRNACSGGVGPAPRMVPARGKSVTTREQGHIKWETITADTTPLHTELTIKTEVKEGLSHTQLSSCCGGQTCERSENNQEGLEAGQPFATAQPTPVLSSLLVQEKLEDAEPVPMSSPNLLNQMAQANPVNSLQQNHSLPMMDHQMNPNMTDPSFVQGAALGNFPHGPPPCQNFRVAAQQTEQDPQPLGPPSPQNRPLLLDEQPLLLQDLLDQERQEQQQQRQMQAIIRQRSSDSFFPNIDFDAITDPIMKAKMVALKGINKVMVQNSIGITPIVMNRGQLGSQQVPGAHCPDGDTVPQHAVGQDGKLTQHLARSNPPNFGPGYLNDSQKEQYEGWLKETQQLLQMQQKFLEEQIGAHRKSKKALSAKQRTAKKAGRKFLEEDLEQLRHVTEQQGVVQKQLEQIRKQQKEHAELIDEYRVKQQEQQQCAMMPGALSQGPMMSHMMQMQQHRFSQPAPPRMPGVPGWQPGAPTPMGAPRMPPHLPSQMPQVNPSAKPVQNPLPVLGSKPPAAAANGASSRRVGGTPHVKFDDNNPFSEGFQERERRERLREQQERQRVQLMQEVERQRALQQRLEQGMLGADAQANRPAFYSADPPRDFTQPQRPSVFPQQQGVQLGFMGSPSGPPFIQGGERHPTLGNRPFCAEKGPNFQSKHPILPGFGFEGPGVMPQGAGNGLSYGVEPATPLPPNYPGSGQSLIQLYSNIIPEEKKKKRSCRKKKDEDGASTPQSDLTAPLTCISHTLSTPTRSVAHPGLPDSSPSAQGAELEQQLSVGNGGGAGPSDQPQRTLSEVKLERAEPGEGPAPKESMEEGPAEAVKMEASGKSPMHSAKGESGNELLKHLLKNKSLPPVLPSPRPADGPRSEDQRSTDSRAPRTHAPTDATAGVTGTQLVRKLDLAGPVLPEQGKKKQCNRRAPKTTDKPTSRYKKRRKEEEVYPSTDTLMTPLKQLSLLPLMEPMIGVSFAHFPPHGSGQLNGESRLSGTFGSASLDGMSDYYSQLIYKNNLSNPPPLRPPCPPLRPLCLDRRW